MGGGASKSKKAPIVGAAVTTGSMGTEVRAIAEDAATPGNHPGQLNRAMIEGDTKAAQAAETLQAAMPAQDRRDSDSSPGAKRKTSAQPRPSIRGQTATETTEAVVKVGEDDEVSNINQYTLYETLGSGAFGTVRRAIENADTDTAAEVAIKVLDKKALRRQRVGKRGNALQNVQREIAVWKKLDNQHCVKLFEVIDDVQNDTMYMVAEFVEGGAVMDDKVNCEPLPPAKARNYFRQLLLGVSYLHHHGIVHRDIKPGNLLVQKLSRESDGDRGGKSDVDVEGVDCAEMGFILKLADYGVSEAFGESDAKKTTAGTAAFMAPEMLTGAQFSGRGIDLWACGITLYMFLYGTVPFHAETIPGIYEKIQNDAVELPVLPTTGALPDDALADLLLTMLAKDPEARFDIETLKSHPWVCGLDIAPKLAEGDSTPNHSTVAPTETVVHVKEQRTPPQATRAQVRQVEAAGKLRVRARRRHSVLGPQRWDWEQTTAINATASVQDSVTESDVIEAVSKVYSLKTILHAKIAARKVKQRATLLAARASVRIRARAAARAKAELEERLKAMSVDEREKHFAAQKMQGQWRARDARKAMMTKRDAAVPLSSATTEA